MSLKWHELERTSSDGFGVVNIMGAASDEGVGMLVEWQRIGVGPTWRRWVTSTEGGDEAWLEGPPEEGDPVPEEPPFAEVAS